MQPNISLAAEEPTDTPIAEGPIDDARPGLIAPVKRGRSSRFIGEIVIDLGYGDREAVDAAIVEARASGRNTGSVLVERGVLSPYQLARVIAERFGVDFVDLGEFTVDHAAASLITPETARRYECVPIAYADERTLLLATPDPANVLAIDDIAMMTALDVRAVVASREELGALIARLGRLGDVMDAGEGDEGFGATNVEIHEEADDAPIVKLVHSIIAEAVELGASDVHFAPVAGELSVQYRIDGVLAASQGIPARMARGVVSRVKIMANLDIAERRQPQDGRLTLAIAGRTVDVRVVTLPLVSGESVVLRILDHHGGMIELDKLGLGPTDAERLTKALQSPYGSILVTGPTGSGKTTTLYGAVSLLNTGDRSIITIEDPVEYRIDGIKQMQVNSRAGVQFASSLRAMVRADPDVIMVGEVRDQETARIATEAALTGHLVLSTLHTRDAATALTRLIDMGVEPFLVASAIDCVVGQRLARVLCQECKHEIDVPAKTLRESGYDVAGDMVCWDAEGCPSCSKTGYRGRVGIYEIMTVTEDIRSLVMRGASGDEIKAAAIAGGMSTLRDDGFEKVKAGVTSLAEIARVSGI
jgi:type IV pilus assembly protein PilB